MLIGTAGHIDHGKTTLVRALTGIDTDRLPEEKRRGITIELGYAYLPLPGGEGSPEATVGFIDVPGHEKFVPTMLAGANGIDFALLVVAADDGPMPQTREHLQILQLLGVARGAVALTKADRASPERLADVEAQLHALLAGGSLAGAPVFPVSAISGDGIAALRQHLLEAAATTPPRADNGHFRLAVDRVFTLAGAGTIVAGTVHAGRIAVGDGVQLAPAGKTARVRSLHVQNRKADSGHAGQRCALNLAGLTVDDVRRGDWLIAGGAPNLPAQRLDLHLRLAADAPRALAHGASVHIHHGTRHVAARVALLDATLEKTGLAPGACCLAQLHAEQPLHACRGDLLVIRDAHGRATLGGGRVLDPFGPVRHRRHPERLAVLAALAIDDPVRRLQALLDAAPLGLDLHPLAAAENIPPDALLAQLPAGHAVPSEKAGWLIGTAALDALAARVEARLAEHHAQHPDELGVERDRLRRMLAPQLPAAAFAEWLETWLADGRLARTGAAWHLPDHRVELDARDRRRAATLLPWLAEHPFDPPWVRDIALRLGEPEAATRDLLKRLAARGEAFQVVRDLFYAPAAVRALGQIAAEIETAEGAIHAARFRDRSGLGRKRAIQILEFFDRVGYTRKVGRGHDEKHRIRGELPIN
ncbi:selenocysteine-specific translation elongation factor [Zoogloea sp.]|uniref:selenocysteine-specific translation elongation factor n=1 Tax=Zoogloea sp. TaxID=49181 RepID=UPI0035B26E69